MSRIADPSLEAVRAAVDMVDLVGGSTQLKRSGSRWVGRCPFHEERTASFSVNPVDKLYHCFGCQRGGDHIQFVRETRNVDFVGAVEWLAERYGVELAYEQSSPQDAQRREERARLFRLLDDAAGFYTRFLWEAEEAEPARAYLTERGIGEPIARTFRLGLSPQAWDRVCKAALAKSFTAAELDRAGLSVRGKRGPVDRFRDRLMFPLADPQGRVRGFGARQMPGGEPPKYKNSPDRPPLFRKSELVYGLDCARGTIAQTDRAIVVEGYTDVLALHQAGVTASVASMGTALTQQQVTELRRLCSTIFLAFDADAAGQDASLRGMELALAQGLVVRIVSLPDGRDPADVAVADPAAFGAALDVAVGYLTFRVTRILDGAGTRDQIFDRLRTLLSSVAASVERDEQVRVATDRLGLTADLAGALTAAPAAGPVSNASRSRARRSPREMDERLFLGMCLALGSQGDTFLAALDVADFGDASLWEAAAHIRRDVAGEATPEEAHTWAPLKAELSALAARERPSPSVLEELFTKIKLHGVEAALKNLPTNADLGLSQQTQLMELQRLRLSYLERLEAVRAQAPDQQ